MKEFDNTNSIESILASANEGVGVENILKEAQTSSYTDFNFGANRWKSWSGSCPKCGSLDTEYDPVNVLTSLPPKYNCRCKSCENTWYGSKNYDFPSYDGNLPYPSGRTGWICPKCGRGISPDLNVCPYCNRISNIIYCNTTNTLDQGSTYANISLNKVNENELC